MRLYLSDVGFGIALLGSCTNNPIFIRAFVATGSFVLVLWAYLELEPDERLSPIIWNSIFTAINTMQLIKLLYHKSKDYKVLQC